MMIDTDNPKKCLSGKNSYEDEKSAQYVADLGMYLRKNTPLLSTYFCLLCYKWHLTSKIRKS